MSASDHPLAALSKRPKKKIWQGPDVYVGAKDKNAGQYMPTQPAAKTREEIDKLRTAAPGDSPRGYGFGPAAKMRTTGSI